MNESHSIAPLRNVPTVFSPWEGNCTKKPWDYNVTAAIPLLDTPDTIALVIELLRLQTERPFIVLIDTGSEACNLKKVQELADEDVEVHSLRLNGVIHPSDFPAMAMDLAFTLCRTEYLFATHADVFLRRRNLVADFMEMCRTISPVVGYEMSPRAHKDWHGMVSHTATMFHIPSMDKIGFGWSQRRLCNIYGVRCHKPDPLRPNWPDTEILGNYILRKNNIKPHLVGHDLNFTRQVDDNIDHCRSLTAARLYSPDYTTTAEGWWEDARKEALNRIESWKREVELEKSKGKKQVHNQI